MRNVIKRLAPLVCILGGALACGGASTVERQDPGVVLLEGALGNAYVPAGESAQIVARVRVGAGPLGRASRSPINLAVVVDTSGSMQGEPIEDARAASLAIVDLLSEGDRLSVTVFHSSAEVLLPSTRIDDNLGALRRKIATMEARGTTDMAGGLQIGLQELMASFEPDGINRLVLLGDGVPNDATNITAMAQAAGERGIEITALGLGLDYDEALMGQIAQLSGGRFHYVEESQQVATVFRDEVMRMQRVVARNSIVTLQPGPGVTIDQVVGQNLDSSSGAIRVTLGDLYENEMRDIIVRATVAGRRAGASVELFDARLDFEDAVDSAGALERNVFLGARATGDAGELRAGRNAEVERAAARMQAAAVTVEAIRVARGGELDRAREILSVAEAQAQAYAAESGDDEVAREASSMRSVTQALPTIATPGRARAPSVSTTAGGGAASGAPPAEPEPAASEESERDVRRAYDRAMDVLGF